MSKYNRKRKIQDDDRQDNKISKPNEEDDLNKSLTSITLDDDDSDEEMAGSNDPKDIETKDSANKNFRTIKCSLKTFIRGISEKPTINEKNKINEEKIKNLNIKIRQKKKLNNHINRVNEKISKEMIKFNNEINIEEHIERVRNEATITEFIDRILMNMFEEMPKVSVFSGIDWNNVISNCNYYLKNKYKHLEITKFTEDSQQLKKILLKTVEINIRQAKRALIKKEHEIKNEQKEEGKEKIPKKTFVQGIKWKLESTNRHKYDKKLEEIRKTKNNMINQDRQNQVTTIETILDKPNIDTLISKTPNQNPGTLIYNAIQYLIKDFYQIRIETTMLINLMYRNIMETNELLPYPTQSFYKRAMMLITKCDREHFNKENSFHQLNKAYESYIKLRPTELQFGRRESATEIINMIALQLETNTQTYIESKKILYKRTRRYYNNIDKACNNLHDETIMDPLIKQFQNLRTNSIEEIKNYVEYHKISCDPSYPKYEINEVNYDIIQDLMDNKPINRSENRTTITVYNFCLKGLFFNKLMRYYQKLINELEHLEKSKTTSTTSTTTTNNNMKNTTKKFSIFPSFGKFTLPYIPFSPSAINDLLFKLKYSVNPRGKAYDVKTEIINKYFVIGYKELKKLTSRKTKDELTNQNIQLEENPKWKFSSCGTDGRAVSVLFRKETSKSTNKSTKNDSK